MALLSELVKVVADVEGMDEVSVGIFARAAREAGYISQKGRGRGAAHMTSLDAANLLIAVNGASLAKDVPKVVPEFSQLTVLDVGFNFSGRPRACAPILRELLNDESTFGDKLVQLIELARPQGNTSRLQEIIDQTFSRSHVEYASKKQVEVSPRIEIDFSRPNVEANITLISPQLLWKDRYNPRFSESNVARVSYGTIENDEANIRDRWDTVSITDWTLSAVAEVLDA